MNAHNPDDVIKFFGGVRATQEALGKKSRAIVYYWRKQGRMPELLARRAAEISHGRLKFDHSQYLDS